MKKTSRIRLMAILILISLLSCSVNVYAVDSEIKVLVDGKKIQFDQPPVLVNNRVLVPMRAIFEALGYTVTWDENLQMASADKNSSTIKTNATAQLKTKTLYIRETEYAPEDTMQTKPIRRVNFIIGLSEENPIRIIGGRTLIPTRAIAEALGCKVDWDGATKTVTINTTNANIIQPNGWADALVKHYETYMPNDVSNAVGTREQQNAGKLNYDNRANPSAGNEPAQPTATPDADSQKVYKVYDYIWNREFEYTYKQPPVLTSPPKVGTAPAKILIDESYPNYGYKDATGKWIPNLAPEYNDGTTGGCEWYAGGRFWEVYGIPLPHFDKFFISSGWLDAADQYDEVLAIRDVYDIRANSVAVFLPNTTKATSHVLFVEYVERDANNKPINVYFSEGNTHSDGEYHYGDDGGIRVLSFEKFILRGAKDYQQKCIGYVIPSPEFFK